MKYLAWSRRHKWLTFLILIVSLIAGGLIYYKVSLELNRRAFQQASQAIDTIYADIVQQIGPPDDNDSSKSCGGFLGVYGEGPASCYIERMIVYPVKDKQQADQLRERIQSIVKEKNLFILTHTPNDSATLTQTEIASAPITDKFKTRDDIECAISYIFDPTFDSSLILKDSKANKQFYISFRCSGPANAKYF